jgi:nickel transport protein
MGILLGAPSAAWAHKVNVFAYVEGNTVVTESYFSDGHRCRESRIEVFDGEGTKLLEGTTDAEGVFSFQPPERTDLLIRLTATMGHQAEYTVPATDLPETLPTAQADPGKTKIEFNESVMEELDHEAAGQESTSQTPITQTELEALVERAVARQLAPIRRTIEEARNQRRIADIVGGIGYIIGLMGVVLYFHARRRHGK